MARTTGSTSRRRTKRAVGLGLAATMLIGMAISVGGSADAQESVSGGGDPFTDVSRAQVDQARSDAEVTGPNPDAARELLLNRGSMAAVLAGAPAEGDGSLTLELPAPDGSTASFAIWKTPVMAPELAARFPEISTYGGQGVDDPAATIVADLTPQGFHAQVLSPNGNWYIDPAIHLADTYHLSFYRADYTESPHGEFIEHNADEVGGLFDAEPAGPPAPSEPSTDANRSGTQLRTHRLVVAANEQYVTSQGGTVALAQAAIVTAINRVTGIYEVEVSVRLQLVANNNTLIFTDSAGACTSSTVNIQSITGANDAADVVVTTSAAHGLAASDFVEILGTAGANGKWDVTRLSTTTYSINRTAFNAINLGAAGTTSKWDLTNPSCNPFDNTTAAINMNQRVVDFRIGDAFYDVGHVFTTGSGGVAGLGVVGITGQKARGTTGLPNPTGDAFFVDFVAHELGHQYAGTHTWNGNRGNCSAGNWPGSVDGLEPGSGSTIQAYAGICGLDDLQNNGQAGSGDGTNASDPYFHSLSFDQMKDHVDNVVPLAGTTAPTGNSVPTVAAGPDITIPAQTPFFLGATGADANGADVLTYNFEQRDGGPQRALDNPSVTSGPMFRSFPPTSNRTSFFPRLADVASGNTNQNGPCAALDGTTRPPADCWAQFLPQVAGPPSVGNDITLDFRATVRDNRAGGGGVNTDDTVVTVRNTGTPFEVNTPNGGASGGNFTVTWDVAGTTAAPISAATVSIRLSTDGGLTFPIVLATNAPNDGSQAVVATVNSSMARIMVHSGTYTGGSGFFDMSDANINLTGAPATAPSAPSDVAGTPGNGQVAVSWTVPVTDGGSPITGYTVTAAPGGATCTTTGATGCTVTGLTNGTSYTFTVTATNAIGTGPASPPSPSVTPAVPATAPSAPRNVMGTAADGRAAVSWTAPVSDGGSPITGYTATAAPGGATCTTTGATTCTITGLTNGTAYTFTVTAKNAIGTSPASTASAAVTPMASFVPVDPFRVEDTRGGTKVGDRTLGATALKINVFGEGGLPASGVGAVSLNVTVAAGELPVSGGGYVTVDGCASPRPNASNLNFGQGETVPNAVLTPVSTDGDICVFVYGRAHILVDINGWFPTTSDFTSVDPFRVEDTRGGTKVGDRTLGATALKINVFGEGGLPASGVGAVSLNVTVAAGELPVSGGGYVTVDGCASPRPNASNLNFGQGETVPNAVLTPVSTDGDICVFVYGRAHILVDINGWFPTTSDFTSVDPFRVEDTRGGTKVGDRTLGATALKINVFGEGGLPASGVGAVSLNVTVAAGELPVSGGGYVTVDGCASPRPNASNLNFGQGETVPNAVLTPVSTDGDICVFVYGRAHILVDINGWFPT